MIDYQKIARHLKDSILEGGKEPSLKSYLQSISESLSNLKLSSKSDQRRVEIAQKHMKEVRKHVRRLEEKVVMLEEQVQLLEEENTISKKLNEAAYAMFSVSGQTPKDVADNMKGEMNVRDLSADNYQKTVGKYLLQSGVLDEEWPEWEEAVWLELTK
jgi:cell division protein FtsB